MHPLTVFFNYLKRIDFSLALAREHIGNRALTDWYPAWVYELMETDEARNRPYRDAISEAVRDRIVLELGTGRKALWAIYCARAGAKRVYAVEANKRAYEDSLDCVRSQGLGNVTVLHGFSDRIELPERCDVLVHDLVGDIGSSEGMIPFIADAKRRLLKADATHIPRRCQTYAVVVEDPRLSLAESALSYALRGFRRFDDLDFVRCFGFSHAAQLGEPQVFEDLAFDQTLPLSIDRQLRIQITRDGMLRGVCFFIQLFLSETRMIDTWASATTWATPYVRFKTGTPVRRGDAIDLRLQSDLSGNPSYSLKLVLNRDGAAREIGEYAWSGD